ncbi:MAG: flavin reductase, partial [Lachnospiraceae bacterium]|nr:flavin reductase [Lachnospiraceae bacterium]
MDNKALYNLSYGVFMLSTKAGDKVNGCITNTCMQVASNPTRVAISVLNTNYTCDLIKESGIFALSILDQTVTFESIKYFGYQSGRDVDKMGGLVLPMDINGVPYMGWQTCAVISCKVISSQDLGSHTLFVAEVVDAKLLNDNAPLTYADYQNNVKPKPEKKR